MSRNEAGLAPEGGPGSRAPADQVTASSVQNQPGGGWGDGVGGRDADGMRRSEYITRDLTSGSIPKNLWFLAWPQFIEGLLRVVDQLADLVWAGFLGHRAIAGMGAAQQYALIGFTARLGMDWAMRAMVSRAIGMGDTSLANRVVVHSIIITTVYCTVLIFVGLLFTEPLLRLLGISEAVIAEGAGYMRVQFVSQAFVGLHFLTSHALAAAGDTFTPMKATFISRLIHIALSPILVFGFVGIPAIGLAGAALANVIGHVLSLGFLLWVLFSGSSRLHLTLRGFHFEPLIIKQLLKIGVPASVNGMERNVAQTLVLALLAPFGDMAVAAFTLTRRVEMLGMTGAQGLGNAAGTIVGQSLGAGKPERAKVTVLWAAGAGLVVNGFLGVLILLFPDAFLFLFTRDSEFLPIAQQWLMIQVIGFVFVALTQVFMQAFQQAGDTLPVMLVTLVTMWAIELPLALFLSRGTELGQLGIAWAIVSPMVTRPIFFIPYFFWGRWLRIDIFGDAVASQPVTR